VAAQAPVQSRSRDIEVDELPDDSEQVIQGQQQHAAQLDDDQFLSGAQRGGKGVQAMRPILRVVAALPLASRGNADVVAFDEIYDIEMLDGFNDKGKPIINSYSNRIVTDVQLPLIKIN